MGGDEFLIVKVGPIKLSEIKIQVQNLLDLLKNKYEASKKFTKLSASVGISQGILGSDNADKLLQHSDAALYKAKDAGRNCYAVYE